MQLSQEQKELLTRNKKHFSLYIYIYLTDQRSVRSITVLS